ncbi:AAA family ATPase [Desulfopila sp. IMCC35006]|uniref:AAA family ATPase n=1 Tax=Desulfopila sp. IMCC35006 TaxID=2569542 RepID=UPI00197A7281|nr:AAA family ATPase [Desulfopila sp. IMCC35006]
MGKALSNVNASLNGTKVIDFLTNTKPVKNKKPTKICSAGMGDAAASWTEKYRARTLDELIVPDSVKKAGARIIKTGRLQNLLLHGNYGIGKTSFAEIIINELKFNALTPKSRLQHNIRDLYALSATTSVYGSRYIAMIDEADHLQIPVQKEILRYLEGFDTPIKSTILIANDVSKIHDGVVSRVKELSFDWEEKEQNPLTAQLKNRLIFILNNENVMYKEKDLDDYINEFFIDFWDIRKIINELQGSVSIEGELLSCC